MKTESTHPIPWLLRLKLPGSVQADDAAALEGTGAPAAPADGCLEDRATLPDDTLGLALSGGGIRSASFCLGVLQALARADWLRRVDYLSTVSGGGYVGAFLGRFFDICHKAGGITGALPNRSLGAAQDRVRQELSDSRSPALTWLRQHSNYLSPTGLGEMLVNLAAFWRNFLSVHLVLVVFFFLLFGVMNAVGYSSVRGAAFSTVEEVVSALAPISAQLPQPWSCAWATLSELAVWLVVVPLMLAYWLVSQDRHESFVRPVLAGAALLALAGLIATFNPVSVAVFAMAVVWALEAWAAIRRSEGHGHPGSRFRLALARNHLTHRLAFWAAATAAIAALGVVDALGQWLARLMLEGGLTFDNLMRWFGGLGAVLVALAPILRTVAGFFATRDSATPSLLVALAKLPYFSTLIVLLLGALVPLVALSFAGHAAYGIGYYWVEGVAVTAVALVLTYLLGRRECVQFVNRSGPLTIYTARLARAFMGAVNPVRRRHVEGRNVTHVVAGDDLPFDEYRPHDAGGPLHIVNCALNETVDVASQRGQRDRQAENFAIGPAGVDVAQQWHALWTEGSSGSPALMPLGTPTAPHPLLSDTGNPVEVERLNVRQWIGISGAAVSPGMGRQTGTAQALLFTLANLRLGYWWNSGLTAVDRQRLPLRGGVLHVVKSWLARWFRAQWLLLSELRGRFGGPWQQYWYLSDGGNFENTGAYELLRRRVPFVIVCDAGQDRKHEGSVFANLVRLVRVDLGAEVEEVDANPEALLGLGVPEEQAHHLGDLRDLLPTSGNLAKKHAVLFRVKYPLWQNQGSKDPWHGRSHTWLLYIKATLTGDETADLRNYSSTHPDFPNESTLDQFFDEPQWESYRKLGEHIGEKLFA